LQVLTIETAEAFAEWQRCRIREDWGFPDSPGMTMVQRFTSCYCGKRYSFGYAACPNLEDQADIWKLLKQEEIGVQLTDGFMKDPEASAVYEAEALTDHSRTRGHKMNHSILNLYFFLT